MTPSELRQAAKRIVMDVDRGWVSADEPPDFRRDCDALARHVLATVREDDDEPADDTEWLDDAGFRGQNNEDNVDVYTLRDGDLVVMVALTFNRGEVVSSLLSITWTYVGSSKVSMYRGITDNPTRSDVRRLCAALGITLREGATDGE